MPKKIHRVIFPSTINPVAYRGLAGDIIREIEPHTEADPIALLVSFLAEFGVMIGRGPHMILDGSRHPLFIYPVLVGKSSKSRKGSAGKRIKCIFQAADANWTRGQYRGTLSSGEGLVSVHTASFTFAFNILAG